MNLVKIEAQYDFPGTDISDGNAAMLELLVQNRDLIKSYHDMAERIRYLYELGHATLNAAAWPNLDDKSRLAAFSHGIATYEAVSAMVCAQLAPESRTDLAIRVMSSGNTLKQDFGIVISDARDRFTAELPRTTRLIGASAGRFYPGYSDYAISGAASARELEIGVHS